MPYLQPRSILLILSLLGFSSLVQTVIIARAVTTELDAVRFVAAAQAIDEHGLLPAVRRMSDQPLYPMAIWLVHEGLEHSVGEFRTSWVLSAQVAAAISLVLSVVPVYFLSKRLVGPDAALAGSLLFCVLPKVCRLGGDGISDSTHLLLVCVALWSIVVYFTGTETNGPAWRKPSAPRSPGWLFMAGSAIGLGLLARAEILVVAVAITITLGVLQLSAAHRQPWPRLIAAIGCLAAGLGLVLGPYLVAAGETTASRAIARVLGQAQSNSSEDMSGFNAGSPTPHWQLPGGESMSFARKDPSIQIRRHSAGAIANMCIEELSGAFGYWVGPFVLVGLWQLRRSLVRPVDRFNVLFAGLYALLVIGFASREGYLCSRHLLAIVAIGIGVGGYGLLETGRHLARLQSKAGVLVRTSFPWLLVAAAVVPYVGRLQRPLNDASLCHREAAEWLADKATAPGMVLDTFGLTGLYSGRKTQRYSQAATVLNDRRLAYVVLESRELEYDTSRGRTLRTLLAAAAEPAASFTSSLTARGQRKVVVYRWHPDRFVHWLAANFPGNPKGSDTNAQACSSVRSDRSRSL